MFNAARDICLLKEAIQQNPWQLGAQKWIDVSQNMLEKYEYNLTARAVKERVHLLLDKKKKEEMKTL